MLSPKYPSASPTAVTKTVHLAITFLVIFDVTVIWVVPFFTALRAAVKVPEFAFTVATFVLELFHVSVSVFIFLAFLSPPVKSSV